MLAELLQPVGPELARRWLAALLSVPRDERQSVVEMIEKRIVELYSRVGDCAGSRTEPGESTPGTLNVTHPPVQRDGYVEQTIVTYERSDPPKSDRADAPQTDRDARKQSGQG